MRKCPNIIQHEFPAELFITMVFSKLFLMQMNSKQIDEIIFRQMLSKIV